jgi:hypothetical protein
MIAAIASAYSLAAKHTTTGDDKRGAARVGGTPRASSRTQIHFLFNPPGSGTTPTGPVAEAGRLRDLAWAHYVSTTNYTFRNPGTDLYHATTSDAG